MFPYTLDNKRYHTLNYYNRVKYGGKVYKASIDAGLTCPNRDGTCGSGGCIYCDSGSRYFAGEGSVEEQIAAELARIHRKNPDAKAIAYFQAGSNTYAPIEKLRSMWECAISMPDIVGLSVATRADCLSPEIVDLLAEFHNRTDLTVELGLQTIHNEIAEKIGRGHSYQCFLDGYRALKDRGIRVCVHLIDGLPGETEDMMLESARAVGKLRPDGVKLHLLHVIRGTDMEKLWRADAYIPMEQENYIRVITEQLRYFPTETVIERLTGDGDRNTLLAPMWSRNKIAVLGGIDHTMAKHDYYQGDLYKA